MNPAWLIFLPGVAAAFYFAAAPYADVVHVVSAEPIVSRLLPEGCDHATRAHLTLCGEERPALRAYPIAPAVAFGLRVCGGCHVAAGYLAPEAYAC